MAHTEPAILEQLSTPYLHALGELAVCARRLRRVRRLRDGDAWAAETDRLLRLDDALAARLGEGPLVEHGIAIRAEDGTMVPADVDFVRHLVVRIERQLQAT